MRRQFHKAAAAVTVILTLAGAVLADTTRPASAQSSVEDLQRQLSRARRGNADAQFYIGRAFETGTILDRDPQQAVSWYLHSAKRGNIDAQFRLAKIFHAGAHGVTRQPEQAVKLYKAAAQRGHTGAQNWLGYAYQHGHGVVRDYGTAVDWYRNAADQGHSEAQSNLGLMYLGGHGIEQDHAAAAEWFGKAANQGHTMAMNNLAGLHEAGWGVQRDLPRAQELYQSSALLGNDLAIANLNRLGIPVPPEAERQARLARLEREGGRIGAPDERGASTEGGELREGGELQEGEVIGRDGRRWQDYFDSDDWDSDALLSRDSNPNPNFGQNWFGNALNTNRTRRRRQGTRRQTPQDSPADTLR